MKGTGLGSILGNRVTRVEDPRFLTGRGQYVDSIHFPNEVWCAYVRSPYAHATIESIDVSDAASAPGVLRVFTAADLTGLNPTPPTRPNLPPAMTRPFLAADRVRFVGEPVVAVVAETPGGRDRRRRTGVGRVRPAAGRHGPRPVRGGRGADLPRRRHEHGAQAGDAKAGRFRRVRSGRQRADRQPAPERCADGAAGRRRLLDARRPARPLLVVPGRARDEGDAVCGVRTRATRRARDRARRRWRVRRQVPHLSGGSGARVLRPRAGPAGAVVGDPHREHAVDAAGPRPGTARHDRRHARRPHHRLPARRVAGRRRLPADRLRAAHDDDAHDVRGVRHRERRLHRGLDGDERGVDHRLSRCRASRGGGRDRAHGRPVRGRDRDRPGRGAAPQRDPDLPRGTHHRGRHRVRRRRLRPFARPRARGRRLRRAACRAGRAPGGGRPGPARDRHRYLRRDHVRRRRFGVRRGRAPARRQPARPHGHDAVRPGSRDDVGDDRLRSHRRADRADHRAARRHRRDPQRRADGRFAFGAARRQRDRGSRRRS